MQWRFGGFESVKREREREFVCARTMYMQSNKFEFIFSVA